MDRWKGKKEGGTNHLVSLSWALFSFILGFLISLSCTDFTEEDKSVAKIHYYYCYNNYNNNGLKY